MTFVFPILMGGLVLAGVPVLLHLIMRQKPKVLLFPAFRFLMQRHRKNQRKLRLRHLLLLALRMLLIAAICLALARPKMFDMAFGLQSDRPVAAVFVIDTSPSMAYKTSDGMTRLAEAQKRALELLDELPLESWIAVLDTADLPGAGPGDWLSTRALARERIQSLRIAPAGGSVTQRLEHAYRLLADLGRSKVDATAARLPRLLCVFSDRTRGAWDAGRVPTLAELSDQAPPLLEGLQQGRGNLPNLRTLLAELRQKLPPLSGQDYPEQALLDDIDRLLERIPGLSPEDSPLPEDVARLSAAVRGRARDLLGRLPSEEQTADEAKEYRTKLSAALRQAMRDLSGVFALFLDVGLDQPVDLAITEIEFPRRITGQQRQVFGAGEKIVLRAQLRATGKDVVNEVQCQIGTELYKQPVSLKAGEKTMAVFEIDAGKLNLVPGPHQAEIRLKAKDLLEFNDVRFVTFAIREPRRVLILADEPARAAEFARPFGFKGDFAYRADVKKPPVDSLQGYSTVYLFGLAKPDEALWKQLDDYVRQGGSIGIIPGDETMDTAAYNTAAAQKIMPAELSRNIIHSKKGARWNWDDSVYQHSLFKKFKPWRDENFDFFQDRKAFYYWDVKPNPKEGAVVVEYKDDKKRPALVERPVGMGRVLLLTTIMEIERKTPWHDYGANSFYVVLVGEMTRYLAGSPDEMNLNFLSGRGDPVVSLQGGARFAAFNVRGPEMDEPVAVAEGQTDVRLKQATAPGNYSLDGMDGTGGSRRVASFSVNIPAEESDLARVPPAEIDALLGPDAVVPVDRRANIHDALQGHWSQPVELFPFLMVALLFALALENLLANKFYKKEEEVHSP